MAATATDRQASLFSDPSACADMARWHREVAEIRRREPVLYCEPEGFPSFWVLTRYADVAAVSRDNAHWLNTGRSQLWLDEDWQVVVDSGLVPATLVHLDGTEHREHRRVTSDWFRPATVARRQSRIDQLTEEFIDRMRDLGGECDFAQDIAKPFALRVIMDDYGVPEQDEPLMLELTQGIFGAADDEYLGEADNPHAKVYESVLRFLQYFDDLARNRQACPRDDLASVIANARIDSGPIGEVERFWYYVVIATAGHDTTSYSLAGGIEAMLHDPAQLWALRDEPDLINNAADECIRWTTPLRHFMRYATEDSRVGDVTFPAGGRVLLSYPSANRDEDVFTDSMTFDVRRSDADKMIAFGAGAHFCLGAQLARRELRTMLARLSQELTHIESAGEAQWASGNFISGVKHLPMAYSFR
jgi:cytochrome P450